MRLAVTAVVLGSAANALVRIHPYELSYYNELIGGPRAAWARGFELTYWYDAFNGPVIADLNRKLPPGIEVDFFNDKTNPVTFQELQCLGELRADIVVVSRRYDRFPYLWLLTQNAKASAFTQLLFVMRPWYTSEPPQLDLARVASVADPVAVSRAWALRALLVAGEHDDDEPPAAPRWVRDHAPWLARFWGDGLKKDSLVALDQTILGWSRSDPEGLLAAARHIAANRPLDGNTDAKRLMKLLATESHSIDSETRPYVTEQLIRLRPEALVEAVRILNAHRDELVRVMSQYGFTDPRTIGGYLDQDLPNPNIQGGA